VSAEREHAASVRAAEDEALRRVHERQKVSRSGARQKSATGDRRRQLKLAEEELARLELRVASLEGKVAALTSALADPALYTRANGVDEARKLGIDLEAARRELDETLADWAKASERLETVTGD
jgi:hypothetical protein